MTKKKITPKSKNKYTQKVRLGIVPLSFMDTLNKITTLTNTNKSLNKLNKK